MAKTVKKIKGYEITVKANPEFCGIGAGGVHFAYGKATVEGGTIVDWYREHAGYEVAEIAEEQTEAPAEEQTAEPAKTAKGKKAEA